MTNPLVVESSFICSSHPAPTLPDSSLPFSTFETPKLRRRRTDTFKRDGSRVPDSLSDFRLSAFIGGKGGRRWGFAHYRLQPGILFVRGPSSAMDRVHWSMTHHPGKTGQWPDTRRVTRRKLEFCAWIVSWKSECKIECVVVGWRPIRRDSTRRSSRSRLIARYHTTFNFN